MAAIFIDGFDKYGVPGVSQSTLTAALQTEYNSVVNFTGSQGVGLSAGLSSTGYALSVTSGAAASGISTYITKALGKNASRLVGGIRFYMPSITSNYTLCIVFSDTTNNQCSIVVNSNGIGGIAVRSGGPTGSVLGTSVTSITASSTHYLEWDITYGSSAAYNLYLDGVAILTGTGNTRSGSSNNYANTVQIGVQSTSASPTTIVFDDLYIFDTTGLVNNAVLLTNPRIETQFPTSDTAVQFTPTANILGNTVSTTGTTNAPGANELFLRPFTPAVNMTLNSVTCLPEAASTTANFKAVLYSDSSGVPHSLLATGAQVTGATSGTLVTSAFSSGQSLTANTQYWIGFITDTSVVLFCTDSSNLGYKASNTYTSGAPSTAPTMTSGQSSWMIYGNCSGAAHNYVAENINPPQGAISYVSDNNVGDADLYGFYPLSTSSATIYTVDVRAFAAILATGTRTINNYLESGSSTTYGDQTGHVLTTTYLWYDSFVDTDPNTGSAWTVSGLNAASAGVYIAS